MATAALTDRPTRPATFDAVIRHWAVERPDRVAMSCEGRELTFRELEQRTAQVVTLLRAHGVGKGDRIAWIGKNSDLYFQLFFGAARLGAVMTPIGWRLAPPEWAYIVSDTGAPLVFTGAGFEGAAAALAGQVPETTRFLAEAETRARLETMVPQPFEPAGDRDAILQLYTSGTTGKPKGVVLCNANLFALREGIEAAGLAYMTYDDDEVVLVAMPCAHIGGTGIGVMALSAGLTALILPEFTPDGLFDAIEQGGVTRFFIVPAALHILLQHPRCASVDFSNLRYILYGASPIPLELLRQSIARFGCQFIQAYGMTETTGTIVALGPEDHDPEGNPRMRSAGKALPGVEIRVVDADGRDCAVGEVGEVMTRSTNNMLGYWNNAEATAKTLTADGWVRTGDAGYLDADGYLYIHDRVKDMIISGGENVYPAEVESAIFGHPDVLEVAVIGVPDEKWGEAVKAIVVPRPGHTIDASSIIGWARERIAGFKVPKSVDVIAALPRNASGKILRRELRAPYWEGRERQVN